MPRESDVHPHVPAERADLFSVEDGCATETEYLALLTALVRAQKPRELLETGSYTGSGTMAIAEGMRQNGFGRLVTLERDPATAQRVEERLAEGLYKGVEVKAQDSLEYLRGTDVKFDFVFLDSHLPARPDELALLIERGLLRPQALIAIHDTSIERTQPGGRKDPDTIVFWNKIVGPAFRYLDWFNFPLSRGLLIARFNG